MMFNRPNKISPKAVSRELAKEIPEPKEVAAFPRMQWGHLWVEHGKEFKCLHCGGVVDAIPSRQPDDLWTPPKRELPLTDEEKLRARAFTTGNDKEQ